MKYTFTEEQKSKLARIAEAMMIGTDILCEAGVPADDQAVSHLAEGFVAVMNHVRPEGMAS